MKERKEHIEGAKKQSKILKQEIQNKRENVYRQALKQQERER